MVIVLMGVSGAGKTTIGRLLAARLGAAFVEGDDFHPPANVEKMRRGIPLDDTDRQPWLERLALEIGTWLGEGSPVVLACSALKARYREVLKGGREGVHFVHLVGEAALIGARLAERRGHYMPPTLLASQLEALEPPADAVTIDVSGTPEAILAEVWRALQALGAGGGQPLPD